MRGLPEGTWCCWAGGVPPNSCGAGTSARIYERDLRRRLDSALRDGEGDAHFPHGARRLVLMRIALRLRRKKAPLWAICASGGRSTVGSTVSGRGDSAEAVMGVRSSEVAWSDGE
jgi:hypothetical protein